MQMYIIASLKVHALQEFDPFNTIDLVFTVNPSSSLYACIVTLPVHLLRAGHHVRNPHRTLHQIYILVFSNTNLHVLEINYVNYLATQVFKRF